MVESSRGAGLSFTTSAQPKASSPASAVSTPAVAKSPAVENNSPTLSPKTNSASPGSEAAASSPLVNAGEIRLELAAVERTWVSVMSDGKKIYSGILDRDETKVFEGHETARIKTGNAAGVRVVFNGRTIGLLGPRGQVRTVVFTPDNFEIVDPASHVEFTKVSRITE